MAHSEAKDGPERIYQRARAIMDDPDTDMHIVELLSVYVKVDPQRGGLPARRGRRVVVEVGLG